MAFTSIEIYFMEYGVKCFLIKISVSDNLAFVSGKNTPIFPFIFMIFHIYRVKYVQLRQ